MMKKRVAKEKEELETAIASGMLQQKGMGKKKRRKQEMERKGDLGLYEVLLHLEVSVLGYASKLFCLFPQMSNLPLMVQA